MKIAAVTGPSGSGKTHLIRTLIREAKSRGMKIAVVKHCAHGFDFDPKGKDSRLFTEAGADRVALVSPDRVAVIDNDPDKAGLRALAERLHPRADIVLVEGGRAVPGLRRIEVLPAGRRTVAPSPGLIAAVGKDVSGGKVPIFAPDQVRDILDYLLLNAAVARSEIAPKAGGRGGDTGEDLKRAMFSAHDTQVLAVLRSSVVAIAGAGGLGSNAAVCLARAGVGRLILVDFDRVEPSNLNRQYYFVGQIGERKVRALRDNLARINPFVDCEIHDVKVTPSRVRRLFGKADILIEAFDRAEAKQMLIETWLTLFPDRPVIAASGLAGYGKNSIIRTRRLGSLYLIGDEMSACAPGISPMAPRVTVVAALQANLAVELLMKARKTHV